VLPLPGDLHEPPDDVSEGRGRHETTVHAGLAAAIGADRAADDDLTTAIGRIVGIEQALRTSRCDGPVVRSDLEERFDVRSLVAAADQRAVRAITEQQAERGHDQGLAGTGLAREGGAARAEGQLGVLDHPQTLDDQLGQHVGPS
jgi:hypothetical protein